MGASSSVAVASSSSSNALFFPVAFEDPLAAIPIISAFMLLAVLSLTVVTPVDIVFEGPAIPIPSVSVLSASMDALAAVSDIREWLQNNMNSRTWVKGLDGVCLILFIGGRLGKESWFFKQEALVRG